MKERRKNPDDNWLDKAQFYLQGMSMENSLLQSYRMIFGAMEAILFVTWFELPVSQLGKLLIFISGLLVCIAWIAVCRNRGTEVTAWREQVKKAVEGTEAETFIKERFGPQLKAKYFWQVMSARLWFNVLLPSLLIIVWSFLISFCFWIPLWVFLFMCVLYPVLIKVFKIDILQL